jgi:IS30 family transposase
MPGIALSAEEREEIGLGLERTETFGDIARGLGRPTSTVSREVNRNGGRGGYSAIEGERRCHRQLRRPKMTVFEADRELAARVAAGLENKDSPMTISRREGVSHESVYQAIYAGGTRGLPAGLGRHLHRRRSRRRCRSRGAAGPRHSPLGTFKPIASRPPEAAEREEIGHFEGDLIIGQRGRSAVITLVDRATTFSMLGCIPYSHDATSVLERLDRIFTRLPEEGYRTLTWDQGNEMAGWEELEARHRIDVYFADPHSPWQRPVNENFNGLLRRWLPKSTDLSVYDQDDLDTIARQINHMPRRSLGWAHANRCYYDALVALIA